MYPPDDGAESSSSPPYPFTSHLWSWLWPKVSLARSSRDALIRHGVDKHEDGTPLLQLSANWTVGTPWGHATRVTTRNAVHGWH